MFTVACRVAALVGALTAVVAGRAHAEETALPSAPAPAPAESVVGACEPCCDPCGPWWAPNRFGAEVALGGWIARMDGELGARGQVAHVQQDFDDVFDVLEEHMEAILQGTLRLSYGRWALTFASSSLRLEADRARILPAGGTTEVISEIWQGQVNLWYRMSAEPLGCEPCSPWVLYDVYVGARFLDVDLELRTPAASRAGSESWVDPVVGTRVAYDFNRRWVLDMQTDIGGFGVSSDFTWLLRLGVEWHPTRHVALKAGWTWIDTDYESGSGSDRFVWDILQDGPYLLFSLAF